MRSSRIIYNLVPVTAFLLCTKTLDADELHAGKGDDIGPAIQRSTSDAGPSDRSAGFRLPTYYNIVDPDGGTESQSTRGSLTKMFDVGPDIAVYSHPYNSDWTPNGGFGYNNRSGVNPRADLIVITKDPSTGGYLAGYVPSDKVGKLKSLSTSQIAQLIKGTEQGGVQAPLTVLPPKRGSEFGVVRIGTAAEQRISEALVYQSMLFPGVAEASQKDIQVPKYLSEHLKTVAEGTQALESVAMVTGSMGSGLLATRDASRPKAPSGGRVPNGLGGTHETYGKIRSERDASSIKLSPVDLDMKNVGDGVVMSGNAVNKVFGGIEGRPTQLGVFDKAMEQGRFRSLVFDLGSKKVLSAFHRLLSRQPKPGQTRVETLIDGVNQDVFRGDTWYNEEGSEPNFERAMKADPNQPPYRKLSDLMDIGQADCRARNFTLAEAMQQTGKYEAVHLVNRYVETNGGREQHTMVYYRQNGKWYVADAFFRQFNGLLESFRNNQTGQTGRWNDRNGPSLGTFRILEDPVDRPMYMYGSGNPTPRAETRQMASTPQ